MNLSNHTIHVSRAVVKAGLELSQVTQLVSKAVWDQAAVFGAQSEMDIYPEEIHMDYVIVQDFVRLKYYMANYAIDKENMVKFTNIQQVQKRWASVKSVERSEDNGFVHAAWTPPTYWGNVLGRTYE